MCESVLEFSGKNPKEEKSEDPTDATKEVTGNKDVTKCETNASETDSFIEVNDDGNANEAKKPDADPKNEETRCAKPKALSKKSPDCVYHGATYRSWFQQLLNLIRGPQFFPDKFVNRVGPIVCSCNTSQGKSGGADLQRKCSEYPIGTRGTRVPLPVQFLPAATKLGQGNIFTGVCLSTGGVCLSACWDIPPWEHTPLGNRHPPDQTPPWTRPPSSRPPWQQTPLAADPPVHAGIYPPWEQTPPRPDSPRGRPPWTRPPLGADPPGKQTPAYSQRVAGTHPTGMHSCFFHFHSVKCITTHLERVWATLNLKGCRYFSLALM